MNTKELRSKSKAELVQEMNDISEELFKLGMQKGVGQLLKPHAFKKARRTIARIKTILKERVEANE